MSQSAEERAAFLDWSAKLSFPALHRLWQLLLKGHDEVARAALPIEAAEMVLLRVIHASSLPDPGDLARMIASGKATPQGASLPTAEPSDRVPTEFAGVMAMLEERGHHALFHRLRTSARFVSMAPGELAFSGSRPLGADTIAELAEILKAQSGRSWKVVMVDSPGEPTAKEAADADAAAERQQVLETPLVRAAFDAFPDAVLEDWTPKRSIS